MAANNISVLVIDDEAVDIAVVQATLERAGFTVFVGSNYDEALAILAAHPEIDLLISDISIPGKMFVNYLRGTGNASMQQHSLKCRKRSTPPRAAGVIPNGTGLVTCRR
jgi:CheY-like chemotaxis protein